MIVIIETTEGTIRAELEDERAPISTANFLGYADDGFFDGTIFHRVISGFMVQCGGFTAEMKPKPSGEPIRNEAGNGLANDRGTLAMARTSEVDSATSQFFINTVDNGFLNHRGEAPGEFGYAVFGKVIEGMDVVEKIEKVPTGTVGMHGDVPVTPVAIVSVRRADGE